MRPDQIEQLKILSDKLFEVVIVECDPDNWIGTGKLPRDLTKAERGDAVWCRRQAAASLTLYVQLERLTTSGEPLGPGNGEDMEDLIQEAEREAAELMRRHKLRN